MSKVAPHNATIEFVDIEGKRSVLKRYRTKAKYSALQEGEAYEKLTTILNKEKVARIAEVFKVNESDNTLLLEFIPGLNLHERIYAGHEDDLETFREALISIFSHARKKNISFDSDPSNILFDDKGIVIIDPICTELPIRDYSFIVFMWGLIKITIRNRRFWRAYKVISYWKKYYKTYCHCTNSSYDALNHQMVEYIGLVIKWNREQNAVEGTFLRLFRRVVVIPIYMVISLPFRLNIIRCGC
jgi:serine/threonine protein kinase